MLGFKLIRVSKRGPSCFLSITSFRVTFVVFSVTCMPCAWPSTDLECGQKERRWDVFFYTLRPKQNGRHFADDTFKPIFLNENMRISIKISPNIVTKGPIKNIPALVQIMAWRRPGDKPLSEPMMVRLPTHICVTRPQWVNSLKPSYAC